MKDKTLESQFFYTRTERKKTVQKDAKRVGGQNKGCSLAISSSYVLKKTHEYLVPLKSSPSNLRFLSKFGLSLS